MVEFRKRLNDAVLAEINEMIIEYNRPDDPDSGVGPDPDDKTSQGSESDNSGTITLDATHAPSYITYPQDINLLN